jgi:hypothetical protein
MPSSNLSERANLTFRHASPAIASTFGLGSGRRSAREAFDLSQPTGHCLAPIHIYPNEVSRKRTLRRFLNRQVS